MHFIDKKKLITFAVGALIISTIVNFPHLINMFYSPVNPVAPKYPFMPPPGSRPRLSGSEFAAFQFLWYYVFSFILLFITSSQSDSRKGKLGVQEILIMISKVIIVVSIGYFVENILIRKLINHFEFHIRHRFDAILFWRYLFMVVISFLTGLLMKLMENQNSIVLEVEKLRSENLQIRYNALTNQMNPHFFFNSLNSLQYLLIEGEQQKSIIYISELSTVFRYILQSSKKELVPLAEEMSFLKSYQYLLNIRFEDKIRFNIDIPESSRIREIPVLTLQPLVENAINHNSCSSSLPLEISLYIDGDFLIVRNNRMPKLRKTSGEGIGLENLKKRFVLLLDKEIIIKHDENEFKVILPLK